jgi:transcriptional regulator with XRE-family HTH domain
MLSLALRTPTAVARLLGERVVELRLTRNWKRETLSQRAGVSMPTLRRLETTGQTSLANLLKVAHALGCLEQFEQLLKPPPARSFAELDQRTVARRRKRGTT